GARAGVVATKRSGGRWVGAGPRPLPDRAPPPDKGMGGVVGGGKVPAVVHVIGRGTRFFGNGRKQQAKRRQFYAQRKELHEAKKVRAVRKSQGKEQRWMRDVNQKLSQAIISHAQQQGVGVIRMERLA